VPVAVEAARNSCHGSPPELEEKTMIIGAHVMIQSSNDQADKGFFKDVLKMPSVDAGGGFLLFGVPPTEIAVHGGSNGSHELYLMCDDVAKFISDMKARGLTATPAQNQGWGIVTQLTLPGGGELGVYQPQHKRPKAPGADRAAAAPKRKARTVAKKPARKTAARAAKKRVAKARRGRK
jgi:hypothetical protein